MAVVVVVVVVVVDVVGFEVVVVVIVVVALFEVVGDLVLDFTVTLLSELEPLRITDVESEACIEYVLEEDAVGFDMDIIDGRLLFEYTEFKSSSLIPTITTFTLSLLIGGLRLSVGELTSFNKKGSFVSKFSRTFSTIECIIEFMLPCSTCANTSFVEFLPLSLSPMFALVALKLLKIVDVEFTLTVGLSLSMSISILLRISCGSALFGIRSA